jgi:hypothetical protein
VGPEEPKTAPRLETHLDVRNKDNIDESLYGTVESRPCYVPVLFCDVEDPLEPSLAVLSDGKLVSKQRDSSVDHGDVIATARTDDNVRVEENKDQEGCRQGKSELGEERKGQKRAQESRHRRRG